METLQVILAKGFQDQLDAQVTWYSRNCGNKFANTFSGNIYRHILQLAKMPTIGQFQKEVRNRTYRSFLAHPKCRIEYWYNDECLTILRLKFNSMSN